MNTKYKIIIACLITCVATAFTTVYLMNHDIKSLYLSEKFMCKDNATPDKNGCCPGETYTYMDELGWNCCPDTGGDCFPPIEK